jgi:hypothetical protein
MWHVYRYVYVKETIKFVSEYKIQPLGKQLTMEVHKC